MAETLPSLEEASRWVGYRLDGLENQTIGRVAGLLVEAPRFNPDEALSAGQERELCALWGIREGQGRAAELADRDDHEVTAVPAAD
jgi:hypothetical protein